MLTLPDDRLNSLDHEYYRGKHEPLIAADLQPIMQISEVVVVNAAERK